VSSISASISFIALLFLVPPLLLILPAVSGVGICSTAVHIVHIVHVVHIHQTGTAGYSFNKNY